MVVGDAEVKLPGKRRKNGYFVFRLSASDMFETCFVRNFLSEDGFRLEAGLL